MSIAGGNTTDDPINYRDLAAANENGEGEYRNKRKAKEHLGVWKKDHQVCVLLYCERLFPSPAISGNSKKLSLVGL